MSRLIDGLNEVYARTTCFHRGDRHRALAAMTRISNEIGRALNVHPDIVRAYVADETVALKVSGVWQ